MIATKGFPPACTLMCILRNIELLSWYGKGQSFTHTKFTKFSNKGNSKYSRSIIHKM